MSENRRKAAFGHPHKFAFAPIKHKSPPRRPGVNREKLNLSEPDIKAAQALEEHSDSIGRLALLAFSFIGATTAIASPAAAEVVQVINEETPDLLQDVDLRAEEIDSIAEEVDEADIELVLVNAIKSEATSTFRISIETDGSADGIKAIREVLDSIEGINSEAEEKTVWAEYAAKGKKLLEVTADITEGLAGLGTFTVVLTAGINLLRGKSDDDKKSELISDDTSRPVAIAVQVQTVKDKPKGPLAKGIKTAEEMSKALRQITKQLAKISSD